MAYLPQVENIFTNLTVKENLKIAGYALNETQYQDGLELALQTFPELKNLIGRRARHSRRRKTISCNLYGPCSQSANVDAGRTDSSALTKTDRYYVPEDRFSQRQTRTCNRLGGARRSKSVRNRRRSLRTSQRWSGIPRESPGTDRARELREILHGRLLACLGSSKVQNAPRFLAWTMNLEIGKRRARWTSLRTSSIVAEDSIVYAVMNMSIEGYLNSVGVHSVTHNVDGPTVTAQIRCADCMFRFRRS